MTTCLTDLFIYVRRLPGGPTDKAVVAVGYSEAGGMCQGGKCSTMRLEYCGAGTMCDPDCQQVLCLNLSSNVAIHELCTDANMGLLEVKGLCNRYDGSSSNESIDYRALQNNSGVAFNPCRRAKENVSIAVVVSMVLLFLILMAIIIMVGLYNCRV